MHEKTVVALVSILLSLVISFGAVILVSLIVSMIQRCFTPVVHKEKSMKEHCWHPVHADFIAGLFPRTEYYFCCWCNGRRCRTVDRKLEQVPGHGTHFRKWGSEIGTWSDDPGPCVDRPEVQEEIKTTIVPPQPGRETKEKFLLGEISSRITEVLKGQIGWTGFATWIRWEFHFSPVNIPFIVARYVDEIVEIDNDYCAHTISFNQAIDKLRDVQRRISEKLGPDNPT